MWTGPNPQKNLHFGFVRSFRGNTNLQCTQTVVDATWLVLLFYHAEAKRALKKSFVWGTSNYQTIIQLAGVQCLAQEHFNKAWRLACRSLLLSHLPCWLCFYSFGSQEALDGHNQTECDVLFFPKKGKKLLTTILSTDDQSVCQWARIIHNQIQSWRGNKVNPLYDSATICVSVLVIGLLCALHHELIQPGVLMIHINTEFR